MNDCILKGLVDLLIFLEFSGDDVVDSDAVVGVMEGLSATLATMPDGDKKELVEQLKFLSSMYDQDKSNFVASLAEYLGLLDE